jgi:hypothetical protein
MAKSFLFVDGATGLWSVDENTGFATSILSFSAMLNTGVIAAGGEAFFSAQSPSAPAGTTTQLWVSMGTVASTRLVATLPDNTTTETDTAGISGLTALGNGEVAFSYFDGQHWSIYLSNGSADGTVPVTNYDGADGQPMLDPGQTAELNGSLLFENTVTGLWSVNESTGVATHLETFTTTSDASVAEVGGKVYFNEHASDTAPNSTTQLWVTDGTAGDATLVASFPDSASGLGDYSILTGITALADGKIVFAYNNSGTSAYTGLYLSGGTPATTAAITGYTPSNNAPALGFGEVAELPGIFLFQDIDSGLWSVNEATGQATNILAYQFLTAATITNLVTIGDLVYFTLSPTGSGGNTELWSTTGTASGNTLIATLPDNTPTGSVSDATLEALTPLANGDLTFTYFDGGGTTTVYLSDGTAGGTRPITGYTANGTPLIFPREIADLACFAEGTRIETESGPRTVETLAPGDLVITLDGPRAVTWIGHRRVVCTRHPRPQDVWPIRVAAEAFGPRTPLQTLYLSPDHAVYLHGFLIPIRYLKNGATIAQEPRVVVTYWHVELSQHAVIFAEGLPTESYLDTGNRGMFENAVVPTPLHPEFSLGHQERRNGNSCAPLIADAGRIELIWRGLAERAAASGYLVSLPATTTGPELCLVVAGRDIKPIAVSDNRYVFVLPPGTATARIASRSCAPFDLRPWLDDRRRLGVPVSRIVWRGKSDRIDIPADCPTLVDGWHNVEQADNRSWRWTDGDAQIRVPTGTTAMEIHLSGCAAYPVTDIAEPNGHTIRQTREVA